ncbi:UvrD-helicase domain-containing protein [Legionella bononiensis]|uniref:DNA 3'-5' helicase II n=1 Tax=Legionella bononiensis TaxID=2793102 RepID=A0ABS1W8E2_9GAMM|nr:UvrD-helicase domain-containing protein [Legionella bononiensis]MBL7479847.1 hypothetical protein [Legionella bononiensis]MBL7525638.1 hypothetical protein [Legionella bononiensis]MBL7561821.1 hypothetical protein [Legionella bononiensis]
MSTEIFYWDGLIMDEAIADKYVEVINQLKNGALQGAGLSLKKMRSHRVFSLSTSYSGRLLFTSRVINQKKCLIFLEELPNHDYKNSKFLNNPATLNQFIEKNNNDFMEIVDFEEEFMDIDDFPVPMDIDEKEKRLYTPVEYYDQEFIVLNNSQKEAKFARGPAVIEGPPGSGKSCAALSLIANSRPELNKILYLTSSPALVSHMEELYKSLPASMESPPGRVVFKSYVQLVHETDPATKDKKIVGQKNFAKWFADYCDRKEQLLKTQKSELKNSKKKRPQKRIQHLPQELLDAGNVYQEFRTTAAYSEYVDTQFGTSKEYTKLKYEALGEKHQSLFKKEHRSWLYQAYQDYATYLRHTNRLDLSFYRLKSDELFDMVVVDEGQDFSKAQIQDITALTSPALQIYFCRDSHQSLEDSQSSGPFIHEHLFRLGKNMGIKAQHIELPCSYRVFPNAQPLVDRILDLRMKLIGGRADNLEYVQLPMTVEQNSTLGSVHWFDKVPEAVHSALQEATQSSDLIIITLPEFIEEAKKFFKTDLVYTVDQVKGLQFPVVVLYRMAEDKALEDANKLLGNPEHSYLGSSSTTNRPAEGVGNPKFGPPLNRFFTAATRAQQQIIVIQPPQHKFSHVINAMRSVEQSNEEFKIELNKQSYSEEKWLDLVKKLIRKNEIPLAKKIYIQHLKKAPIEFKEFLKEMTSPYSTSNPKSVVKNKSTLNTQQHAASSSFSSNDFSTVASVSTLGIFSDRMTHKEISAFKKKRRGRHQSIISSGTSNSSRAPKPLSLIAQGTDKRNQQDNKHPEIKKSIPLQQQNLSKLPVGRRYTLGTSMDEYLKGIQNSSNPGLHLSIELSNGTLDTQKLNILFLNVPELTELITVDQLCQVGEQAHTSLLSQLCSPYIESRHTLLNFLFEKDPELIQIFAGGLQCYLLSFQEIQEGLTNETSAALLDIFQKKSVDFRDIQYLNTTGTGKKILLKLANELNWSTERLQKELQSISNNQPEPNFSVPFQRQHIMTTIQQYHLFASQLNELNEASWPQIIARNNTDDISRKIVRLMIQGNCIGAELWNSASSVCLLDFFNHVCRESAVREKLSENEIELAMRVITNLESNPGWSIIEQLNYIDLELCAPDLDSTCIFSGILRTVRTHLILENRLLNKLYTLNIKFWGNTVGQFKDVLVNPHRTQAILDRLSVNDAVAIKAWNSLNEMEFKNNPSMCSLQFFITCKNAMSPAEYEKCTLLQDIIVWLEADKPWELETYFNYITQCLKSGELGRFSLLAGYLRFAHDYLAKQLLQERLNQRQVITHPEQVSVPEHSEQRTTHLMHEASITEDEADEEHSVPGMRACS